MMGFRCLGFEGFWFRCLEFMVSELGGQVTCNDCKYRHSSCQLKCSKIVMRSD